MPLISYANRVVLTTTTTGTGPLALGAVVLGNFGIENLVDGATYSYLLKDSDGGLEIGQGVYTAAGVTLSRDVVEDSSNDDALIVLPTGTHEVHLIVSARELDKLEKFTNFSGALFTNSINHSIPHNVHTPVSWDTEAYDYGGWHSGANPTRFTVPTGLGITHVQMVGNSLMPFNAAGNYRVIRFLKNGSAATPGLGHNQTAPIAIGRLNLASAKIPVVDGDFLEVTYFQDSGTSQDFISAPGSDFFSIQGFRHPETLTP